LKNIGNVIEILDDKAKFMEGADPNRKRIEAVIPLSEMIGYSNFLRSISKGEGTFTLKFYNFQNVGAEKQAEILENGFY
jgi:translation elongation factor EF-G